jgi:hypothetical protein
MAPTLDLTGLMKVRGCCVFTWREWRLTPAAPAERMVEVGPEHCPGCIEELASLKPPVRLLDRAAMQNAARELPVRGLAPDADELSVRRGGQRR